jgi:hypothetical protein
LHLGPTQIAVRSVRRSRLANSAPGTLTLLMPDCERDGALAVKRGELDREEVSAEISRLEDAVRTLLDEDRSHLSHAADLDRIGAWAIDAQRVTGARREGNAHRLAAGPANVVRTRYS